MSEPTRRGVLATVGAVATAGCSGVVDRRPSGDARREFPDSPVRKKYVEDVTTSFALDRGDHRAFPLEFDTRTVLLFSVVTDENVDVLTFRRSEYRTYEDGSADQLSYVDELSEQHTTATARGAPVSAGEPVVVVDNTTWAEASPVEEVHVEVELDAFVRSEG